MTLTILDAVETFNKCEFLDYLKRLQDKLYEAWIPVLVAVRDSNLPGEDVLKRYDELKDAIDALDLLMNLVASADSATWRYVAKDFIARALNAGRMKIVGWRLDHD
jgi:cellulose biosynthesis protein BcsQ